MGNTSYCRHGREIERVAGVLGEGTDAAFAQNDVVIAFRHNVFGRKQPFLQGRRHPTLEQHRQLRTPDPPKQRVVLHVARANLNHVGIFFDEIDSWFVQRLANDF